MRRRSRNRAFPAAELGETHHAHLRRALEVRLGAIGHLDAVDDALAAALEIERARLAAVADLGAHRDVVRRAVAVDDFKVVHEDGIARHLEADGAELTVAAADANDVAVDEEPVLLATELLLVVGAAVAREARLGGERGETESTNEYGGAFQMHVSSPVCFLPLQRHGNERGGLADPLAISRPARRQCVALTASGSGQVLGGLGMSQGGLCA